MAKRYKLDIAHFLSLPLCLTLYVFYHKPWEIDVYYSLSVYGHFDPSAYLLAAASRRGTLHFRMSCKFTSL